MQTFSIDPNHSITAKHLDYRRLGNQRVEAKQILLALLGISAGWKNHPATKMWQGYEHELCLYSIAICEEWISRGYKDSLLPFFKEWETRLKDKKGIPSWIGNDDFHASHRSNLLRKDFNFYSKFEWKESSDMEYVWPSKVTIK